MILSSISRETPGHGEKCTKTAKLTRKIFKFSKFVRKLQNSTPGASQSGKAPIGDSEFFRRLDRAGESGRGGSCQLADWPSVDWWQLAAAVMPAACCGMEGNGVGERNALIPASKLAGATAAASCTQSTAAGPPTAARCTQSTARAVAPKSAGTVAMAPADLFKGRGTAGVLPRAAPGPRCRAGFD